MPKCLEDINRWRQMFGAVFKAMYLFKKEENIQQTDF